MWQFGCTLIAFDFTIARLIFFFTHVNVTFFSGNDVSYRVILAGDELWLGRSKSRLGAVLCAIAGALLAHKAAIEGNVFNSEADDADGEDDEEEEEEEGELITEATLQELRTVVEGIKASPALSAQVIPVVRSLKKKHRAALAEFGLV